MITCIIHGAFGSGKIVQIFLFVGGIGIVQHLLFLFTFFKDLKPQHNLSSNEELLSFFKLNAMPFLQLGVMQLFEKSSVRSFRFILYHHDVVFIICVLAFSFLSFYHTVFNLHGFKKAFKTISHQIIKRYLPLVLLRQLYCNIDHLN